MLLDLSCLIILLFITLLSTNLARKFSRFPTFTDPNPSFQPLVRSLVLFLQQAPDVATVIKATKHIADEVNGLKKMSSEELTQTVDVLQNVKEKMQNFNTSKKEAGELITVRE